MNLSRALRISRLSNSSWLGVSTTRAIYLFPSLGHGLLALDLCKASWECWLWMSSIKYSFQDYTRVAGFVLKKNSLETWKKPSCMAPKVVSHKTDWLLEMITYVTTELEGRFPVWPDKTQSISILWFMHQVFQTFSDSLNRTYLQYLKRAYWTTIKTILQ